MYDLIFTEGERDGLWPVATESEQHRRSLYLLNKRSLRLPLMMAFDQPDTMTSCPVRPTSTHALQALTLFNSDFMQQQSAEFAARLDREAGGSVDKKLRRAYIAALARPPRPVELTMGKQFLRSTASPTEPGASATERASASGQRVLKEQQPLRLLSGPAESK